MKGWIYALINILPWPLDQAGRWIADRIYSVWTDGIRFAKWIKIGVRRWYDALIPYLSGLREFFLEALLTLRWVAEKLIPARVARALRSAIEYAAAIVNQARNALSGAISTLRRWAESRINDIKAFLSSLVDWAKSHINSLLASVRSLLDRVFNLWGTPERLATWLIGALWTAALRYLYQQRERLVSWILRSSGAATIWLAKQIEAILVRLL